jgi:hypothetical protein
MALIENMETHEKTFLHSYHLFGRNSQSCNTVINNQDVSRSHATLHWTAGGWQIQDHSRNGTLVNGEVIHRNSAKIGHGTLLQFGSTQSSLWKMIDVKPPNNYLQSTKQKERILILETCHALPSEQNPQFVLYKSEDRSWVAEMGDTKTTMYNGMRLKIDTEEWEFIENEMLFETMDYGHIFHNAYFKFCVSSDEEDIRLKLIADDQEYDLGRRTYNYLLLTLTRKRLRDADLGFGPDDQGWLSMKKLEKDVSKELGHDVDAYYLNLQIYRLRKHLMEMKPFGHLFSNVIERRTGELRFAFPQIKVVKDNLCIGEVGALV